MINMVSDTIFIVKNVLPRTTILHQTLHFKVDPNKSILNLKLKTLKINLGNYRFHEFTSREFWWSCN